MLKKIITSLFLLFAGVTACVAGDPPGLFKNIVSVDTWPPLYVTVPQSAASSTMTASVSISTNSIQFVGTNAVRKGLTLYNNSSNSIYIAYDSFANSANHMTFLIPTFTSWTMPTPIYLGPISGIRNAGSGTMLITELQ